MKKLFIISAIAFGSLVYNTANAQIRVRLGLNLAPQRVVVEQTPVYDNDNDDYYYLPDVDAYYDVNNQCYVYFDGENWISAAYLPGEYHDYDWRNARRYEVRAQRPYMHADFYRSKYDGHQFNGWSHNDGGSHVGGGYRSDAQRFDNRGQGGHGQPAQHNGGNDQRFNNGGQGGHGQPTQPDDRNGQRFNNGGQGGHGQPAQPNGGNDQRFNNSGQGGHGQSAQPNGGNDQQYNNHGGNGQPANNGGGHNRSNGGADEHYSQSSPRGGLTAHRMARF